MNCTEFLANLTDYFDAQTAATLRAELEQHMNGCSHCYVTLNTTRQTIEIYRNDQLFELPDSIRTQLRQAVLTRCAQAKLRRKKPAAKPSLTPHRLMQMAWGFSAPLAIEAAVQNGIFDTLDAGPKSAAEIAAATNCSPRAMTMLLDLLAGFELVSKDASGAYSLTPESATFLVSTKPSFQGGIFRHVSRQLLPQWSHLSEVVRTGQPAHRVNEKSQGTVFFEQLVEDIFPMSYPAASTLAESLGIACASRPISVLDIGAGSGVWGIALAQVSPHVTVRAVDWPNVLEITQRTAEKFGLGDRFTLAPGDLLEADFGSGHQIATVGHILHSEGELRSQQLLQRIFQSLAPGGTIAIAEFLVNPERTGPVNGLIFAVNMLVNTTEGGTYSFEEIGEWLHAAGFQDVRTLDSPGPSPLILAKKPGA